MLRESVPSGTIPFVLSQTRGRLYPPGNRKASWNYGELLSELVTVIAVPGSLFGMD